MRQIIDKIPFRVPRTLLVNLFLTSLLQKFRSAVNGNIGSINVCPLIGRLIINVCRIMGAKI